MKMLKAVHDALTMPNPCQREVKRCSRKKRNGKRKTGKKKSGKKRNGEKPKHFTVSSFSF
jgi:hypothetical protein